MLDFSGVIPSAARNLFSASMRVIEILHLLAREKK